MQFNDFSCLSIILKHDVVVYYELSIWIWYYYLWIEERDYFLRESKTEESGNFTYLCSVGIYWYNILCYTLYKNIKKYWRNKKKKFEKNQVNDSLKAHVPNWLECLNL